MAKRRNSRICTLEMLYQSEFLEISPEQIIELRKETKDFKDEEYSAGEPDGYAIDLYLGVIRHIEEIDNLIDRYAKDWKIERMPVVDRNILRISLFEILYLDETPVNVSINEAVEIAKTYGSDDSGRFVNGVLGKIVRDKNFEQGENNARQNKKVR